MWWDTAPAAPETGRLAGEFAADVVVIGAGFTGLSTALHLAETGVSVVVVEAGAIGEGASGRNAGHVSPSLRHGGPEKMARSRGREAAERMVRFQVEAADLVFERIARHAMDCGARRKGRLQFAHTPAAFDSLGRLAEEYEVWGLAGSLLDADASRAASGSERYFGAWRVANAGVVNPLAYARGLARAAIEAGATVLTDSPVGAIRRTAGGWRAESAAGTATAERAVLATDAGTDRLWPALAAAQFRLLVYMLASDPLPDADRARLLPGGEAAMDMRKDTQFYMVDSGDRLVTGSFANGSRGRDEAASRRLMTERFAWLHPDMGRREWRWYWHGINGFSADMSPHLMELAPGLSAGMGYSGRGVPTATAMGRELARHAMGAGEADLAIPLSAPRPVRSRHLLEFAIPRVLGPWFRHADARAMLRDGLAAPRL